MKRAVVIGSGIGGAAVAGLLAKAGLDVTLLERNGHAGGKAGSYERDGYVFDVGVHYSLLGENGPLGEAARRMGAEVTFLSGDPCLKLVWGDKSYDVPQRFRGLVPLVRVAALLGLGPVSVVRGARLLAKLAGAKTLDDVAAYQNVPLKVFVHRYVSDPELENLLYLLCGIMLAVPPETASAGEFMWGLSTFLRAASPAYPKGGFASLPRAYVAALSRLGGRAHFNEGARAIVVQGGRVTGVETGKAFYPADVVVSNAGLKRTIELAGEASFDAAFTARAREYEDSYGGITVKYALDVKPTNAPLTFYCPRGFDVDAYLEPMAEGRIPDVDPPLYIPAPSVIDPTLAPPGGHVLLAGTMVPRDLTDPVQLEQLIAKVDAKVMALFPHLKGHVRFKHTTDLAYMANICGREFGDIIGLAQRFDQSGANKPHPRLPVTGLYLVGCDAGGNYVGTEQAADSALNVAPMVVNDLAGGSVAA